MIGRGYSGQILGGFGVELEFWASGGRVEEGRRPAGQSEEPERAGSMGGVSMLI